MEVGKGSQKAGKEQCPLPSSVRGRSARYPTPAPTKDPLDADSASIANTHSPKSDSSHRAPAPRLINAEKRKRVKAAANRKSTRSSVPQFFL